MKLLLLLAGISLGLVVGFWFYASARNLSETVNFDVTTFLTSLVVSVVVPLMFVALPVHASQAVRRGAKSWAPRRVLVAFAASLMLGSLAAEGWMLRDEAKFASEVSSLDSKYSRARAWPNQTGSLVFVPGRGINGTD